MDFLSTHFSRLRGIEKKFRLTAGLLLLLSSISLLRAETAPIPSYENVKERLETLWRERYPLKPEKFIENPGKQGVLFAIHQDRPVYYYRFQAILKQPRRGEGEEILYEREKIFEIWVRFRPSEKEPYDISFAREDLLPGMNRKWILPPKGGR